MSYWVEVDKYLSTIDLLNLERFSNFETQEECILSTLDYGYNSFHLLFSNWSQVKKFWNRVLSSHIQIHSINIMLDSMKYINEAISGNIFQLGGEHRIICQFNFPNDCKENDIGEMSNTITLPVGGEVGLFKRKIFEHSYVLGVLLKSESVWMCRVAALSMERIDIKAGSTKADTLRVPNSKGSWSDLVPINGDINNLIYVVEFI